MSVVAALPPKHHAHINLTEIRLQQTKQRQQQVKNVCSQITESQHVDWDWLFFSDERKYIYCPVPKVACSSWKLTLLRLTGKDLSNLFNIHAAFWWTNDRFLKGAVNYNATERETRLKSYFKFMFVREPLERLVSAYLDKGFRDPNYRKLAAVAKALSRFLNNKDQVDQGEITEHY